MRTLRQEASESTAKSCRFSTFLSATRHVSTTLRLLPFPVDGLLTAIECPHHRISLHFLMVQRVETEGGEYFGSSDDEDPMDEVVCMECGAGDDESHLLLCDGAHTSSHPHIQFTPTSAVPCAHPRP